MGREVHRLSAKTLERAKTPGYCCDGGGLYLQVSPTQRGELLKLKRV